MTTKIGPISLTPTGWLAGCQPPSVRPVQRGRTSASQKLYPIENAVYTPASISRVQESLSPRLWRVSGAVPGQPGSRRVGRTACGASLPLAPRLSKRLAACLSDGGVRALAPRGGALDGGHRGDGCFVVSAMIGLAVAGLAHWSSRTWFMVASRDCGQPPGVAGAVGGWSPTARRLNRLSTHGMDGQPPLRGSSYPESGDQPARVAHRSRSGPCNSSWWGTSARTRWPVMRVYQSRYRSASFVR